MKSNLLIDRYDSTTIPDLCRPAMWLMDAFVASVVIIATTSSLAGCRSSSPTSPSGSPALTARGEHFEVTGIVTDDAGRPMDGTAVTLRGWLGGLIHSQVTLTNAAGEYALAMTTNPWDGPSGRAMARAELIVPGYEWYYRTVWATGPRLVENFRLHPLQRIVAGESWLVAVAPDDGECVGGLSWTLSKVCRTVRVTAPASGTMTVEAAARAVGSQPLVSVCCVSGDDRSGNPVMLSVVAGEEFDVEVGMLGRLPDRQLIEVKTSFAVAGAGSSQVQTR